MTNTDLNITKKTYKNIFMIWVGFEPGPKNVSKLTLKYIARLEPGSIIFYHYASKTHMKLPVRKQVISYVSC